MTCTGGGGQHIFFWAPRSIPNSAGKPGDGRFGEGVDVRGEGGYVIAAPSRHESGRTYEWDSGAHPADLPLAEVPGWFLHLATWSKKRKEASGGADVGASETYIVGGRNDALMRLGGAMRRVGAGYGGKTISSQALALAVAGGMPLWGKLPIRKGRAIHLDYEQGRPLTQRRYQRIANAMGLQLANLQLQNAIGVSCLPKGKLSDADAEDHLVRICDGAVVCIIDSFRRAFPKAKENDSEASSYLDMVQAASERTGCAMIVIMHTRKAGEDKDQRGSLRGSSALFDAAQTVMMLDGDKGRPTRVTNHKERLEGRTIETIGLEIKDVKGPNGDCRWGLSIDYVSTEDVTAAYMHSADDEGRDIMLREDALLILVGRVIEYVQKRGSEGAPGPSIQSAMGRRASDVKAALIEATRIGAITKDGDGEYTVYFA